MRWIGIDEAGYGPNLGPLVMTAVVAEATVRGRSLAGGNGPSNLDFWTDLTGTVDRAGGDPSRLWVDDSKAILHGGKGRDRLESACLAALHAAGRMLPGSFRSLLAAINAGTPAENELFPWFEPEGGGTTWPWCLSVDAVDELLVRRPLEPASGSWRLTAVESVVVGPARFNVGLEATGSKAEVHFEAFAQLMRRAWESAGDGIVTFVTGDKHGGRHYYLDPLTRAFAGAWIDRGPEGPDLSRYSIRDGARRIELTLLPRADRTDGLVALASIVSKAVRELWMDGFNAYWCTRVPGLRPSAGYPVDARRFRRAIEETALAAGCDCARWWRTK